jgi:glycosyltransferase involved in cell wall biosynthesis
VVKPLTNLHHANEIVADITLEPWVSARQINRADVLVFCRNTDGALLDRAIASGKPIIYNLDDNLLEIPASYKNRFAASRMEELKRYLRAANLVRAYSEPLKNYLLQFNPSVERVDCAVDWRLVPGSAPRRNGKTVSIVYATSRWQEDSMASLFLDDVCRLVDIYRERARVYFWGYHPPELRSHPSVSFLGYTANYDRFFRRFARAGFDIGLAPLCDDDFHRSKCNNKFREYAASRIAGIYSDVSVYSSSVEHERSGLLVANEPGAWLSAMARLIEDDALRRNIQEAAFRVARARYTRENVDDVWLGHIHRMIGAAPMRGAQPRGPAIRESLPHDRMPRTIAVISLARKAMGRGRLLAMMFGREGARQTFQWARLYFNSVAELVRVRLTLMHFSRPRVRQNINVE